MITSVSERDLRVFDILGDGVIIHDGKKILYTNSAAGELVGLSSSDELKGLPLSKVFPPEEWIRMREELRMILQNGSSTQKERVCRFSVKDAGVRVISVKSSAVDFRGKRRIMTVLREISEKTMIGEFLAEMDILRSAVDILLKEEMDAPYKLGKALYEGIRKLLPEVGVCIGTVYKDRIVIDFGRVEAFVMKNHVIDRKTEKGVIAYLVDKGETLYLPNVFDFDRDGYKTISLGIPDKVPMTYYGLLVRVKNRIRGFLTFMRRGFDAFTDDEKEFFRMLRDQVALAFRISDMVSEIHEEKEKYHELAMKDALTGAYSRHFFNEWIEKHEELLKRRGGVTSLIIIDVDNLKAINDSYGHLTGDEVLKEIVRTIVDHIRSMDMVVRYGGDEFLIVLPDTDEEKAEKVVGRIEKALEGLSEDFGFKISFSYGISSLSREKTYLKALRDADSKLYKMKFRGIS